MQVRLLNHRIWVAICERSSADSLFANLQNKYDSVIDVLEYEDQEQLITVAEKTIIRPALELEN